MRRITMLLLPTFFILSCGEKKTSHTPQNQLVIGLASSPATLDPRFATDANGTYISELIFNSLVKLGPDLKIQGDAATSWQAIDKTTYEFILKKNLKFSNGRSLTTEDIDFSFKEFQKKSNPFHSNLSNLKKVTATQTGEQIKVRIKLKNFSATFLGSNLPAIKILPKKESLDLGEKFNKALIGTGPMRVLRVDENNIHLKRRESEKSSTTSINEFLFKIVRDDFTRYQKLLKGELDIVQADLPLKRIADFQKKPNEFSVHIYPGLSFTYLLLNLEDTQLKDKKLRQAIHLGIHREEIIQYKLNGLAEPATSILTPGNPFRNNSLVSPKYQPQKAKELLADKNSPKELVLKTSNSPRALDNGKVLAHQLRKLGLKIKTQSYEWATYYDDVKNGRFQMATMKWIGAFDPDIYRQSLHSKETPPGRNRGRYKNSRLDKLVEEGLSIQDSRERMRHYQKVQAEVFEDLPIIPLWYEKQVAVLRKEVTNYSPSLVGDFSPFLNLTKRNR